MMDPDLREILVKIERGLNWIAFSIGATGFAIVLMLWELKQ